MRAVTVAPRRPSSALLEEVPEPVPSEGPVLLQTLAVGVCGTDREILDGAYGEAPPGHDRLVLGHEAIGAVVEAPEETDLRHGDLVVPIVRHPDPVPCDHCAVGEWDMCRNGRYTEHGIKGRHGFARERFRTQVTHAVRVDRTLGLAAVLLEPASIVAKAWDQIERIGARSRWTPKRVLVLGAGPVGLLATLLGVQRRLEVHVLDRVTTGPKPRLVGALGATYHTGNIAEACENVDVVLECTGAPQLVFDAMRCVAPTGIVCLTGVSSGGRVLSVDAGSLNNELVLENNVVFGTVNANRLHYELAADALAQADRSWLDALITRRVPLKEWQLAYEPSPGDVKTVLQFTDGVED
jgi:threonine dehydrogenase-like Zn-dependent dehydrogenase